MQLYLIRHAESENNARPGHLRVEDPAITAVGRLQAEHLAQWLRTLKFDLLVTSPFLRTLQTVRAVLDQKACATEIWHDVFERGGCYRGYGEEACEGGPGLGLKEIRSLIPEAIVDTTILETGWWGSRKRETHQEAVARAELVERRFVETLSRCQILVAVIHADFKRLLLSQMLHGITDASALGPMRNTGITKVDFDGQQWKLDWFNSISHLPSRLITGVE